MAEEVIKPDLKFVQDVINAGGESLKKCYQCATCTVVCNVAPDESPFPRKEMVQAQWGLKDKLMSNPDIWLCHHCSDCTAYCPRGAKPGEVLGAVRKMSLQELSTPGFMAKIAGSPAGLLALFAVPVAVLLAVIGYLGNLDLSSLPKGAGDMVVYSNLIPANWIEYVYIPVMGIAAAIFGLGILKYWGAMKRNAKGAPKKDIVSAAIATATDILAHKKFNKCTTTKSRSIAHLLVFYSFVGLAITTIWITVDYYVKYHHSIAEWIARDVALTDAYKLLGNASAVALLLGIVLVMLNRFKIADTAGMGSYYDWLFILLVAAIGATGFGSELLRVGRVGTFAYVVYITHLSLVFFLFLYAPFSKMAHMVYRATAMVFSKHMGRD